MKNIFLKFNKIVFLILFFFLISDLIFGKYVYKKFIKKQLVDVDITKLSLKDKIYDHKLAKNFNDIVAWGDKRYKFCTDGNGFRVSCKDINRNIKKFEIGFIGDSFTEGTGVDYENSFVGIIEKSLPKKNIANLGVSSYSPSIYLTKLKRLLKTGYSFDEIIVFVDISDIVDDVLCYKVIDKTKVERKETFKNCYTNFNYRENKVFGFIERNLKFTFLFLNLFIDKSDSITKIENQLNHSRSEWTYNFNKTNLNGLDLKKAISFSLKNMENLYFFLKDNSINLSIAVYPWPGTLKFDKVNNLQVDIWENFCKKKCTKFYNFMPIFFEEIDRDNFYNSYKKLFIKGDIHFNAYSNKLIADNFIMQYNK